MLPVLFLIASRTPLIAYSCRYYAPPGSSGVTYHQIYLCDVRGGHRRQITFDRREHTAVRWVGRDKLAWLESNGVSPDESVGYHFATNSASSIVLYDLRSKRKRVVGSGKFDPVGWFYHLNNEGRGVGVFYWDSSVVPISQYDECVVVGPRSVNLHARPPRSKYPDARDGGTEGDESGWAPFHVSPEPSNKQFTIGTGRGGWRGYGAIKLTRDGHTIEVPDEAEFIWKGTDGYPEWFRLLSRASSAGSDEWICKLDWRHGKCIVMTHDTLAIDFDPASRYWAASSNDKGRARLGKIWVWARTLWVGDRVTGKQWAIASGAVSGDCARVQPE